MRWGVERVRCIEGVVREVSRGGVRRSYYPPPSAPLSRELSIGVRGERQRVLRGGVKGGGKGGGKRGD